MRAILITGALILAVMVLAGCGKVIATGIAPPDASLMVPPRRIKPLKQGGDLKRYVLILAARNGDLVDHVKALQAYAATVSGTAAD
jgi:hypothetical protein